MQVRSSGEEGLSRSGEATLATSPLATSSTHLLPVPTHNIFDTYPYSIFLINLSATALTYHIIQRS